MSAQEDRINTPTLGFSWKKPSVVRSLIILLGVVLWEVSGHTFVDPTFISPPSAIAMALPGLITDAKVVDALLAFFLELAAAFMISVVAGVLIGITLGLRGFTRQSSMPIILLLYSIPQVTILPLFVLLFGVGPSTKIAFGISHGIFPILLNVMAGTQTIDERLTMAARSMGASTLQVNRRVVLPHMIPSLFTGMRLGMSATLLGVILAEFYISTGGIGFFIQQFTHSFNSASMFGLVSILALMAIVLNETLRRSEVRASFWRNKGT
jgi:ABC-type nitrate/sulfonate/bicarbonate transport system permease component